MEDNGNIMIYESDGGEVRLDVRLENDTVWLTQEQLSLLFSKSVSTINYHINNIFQEGELKKEEVFRKIRITTPHGAIEGLTQTSDLFLYNLDVIISVGYRVKSVMGTRFRMWATKRLNEYIRKGYTLDDERLKELGGGGYWKELLNRIRDIRASEKVFYRQILDIYATSVDYDPKADITIAFFKQVQNKIHYAVHGQTAAEVIYSRADAEKEFMGLTTFRGDRPHLSDAVIAKNYLNEKELRSMGRLVSGYLDFAEQKAERHEYMTMADWAAHLNNILTSNGEKLLVGSGSVSHQQAVEKATDEYKKYQQRTLSDVEKAYLDTIKLLEEKTGNK
ncbi:MAG: virulence RhuM family protein [Bacteroidales bacterium]|nr:virulence RhuM family protein [Bacteroidales bacterium]